MTYELAKQLKDAGFPQELRRGYTASPKLPIGASLEVIKFAEHAYFPTLEEVVEACGEDFASIEHLNLKEWRAYAQHGKYRDDFKDYCESDCCGFADGSTPTEAVAKLWLALNKT